MSLKWAKAKSWARIGRSANNRPVSGSSMGMVHYMLSNAYSIFACDLFFRLQFVFINRLLALFVNNNEYWLSFNLHGIWILEHKGATTFQKFGECNSGEAWIWGAKRRRFEGGTQIEGKSREKAGRGGAQWALTSRPPHWLRSCLSRL